MTESSFSLPNGTVFPYKYSLDEDGYSYSIYVEWKGRPGEVFVCESGCHIEWDDSDEFVDTNLIPKNLFGELSQLEDKHLVRILQILSGMDMEGKTYSTVQIKDMYEAWMKARGEI